MQNPLIAPSAPPRLDPQGLPPAPPQPQGPGLDFPEELKEVYREIGQRQTAENYAFHGTPVLHYRPHPEAPFFRADLSLTIHDTKKLQDAGKAGEQSLADLRAGLDKIRADHAAGTEGQAVVQLEEQLRQAEADLQAAQADQGKALADFRAAAVAKGDTRPIYQALQEAGGQIQAARVVLAFVQTALETARQSYQRAWEEKRAAYLSEQIQAATARRAALLRGLAGYIASTGCRVHFEDRILGDLHSVAYRAAEAGVCVAIQQAPAQQAPAQAAPVDAGQAQDVQAK